MGVALYSPATALEAGEISFLFNSLLKGQLCCLPLPVNVRCDLPMTYKFFRCFGSNLPPFHRGHAHKNFPSPKNNGNIYL